MILALVFGLIFGSFINVVIYRLKTPPGRGLFALLSWRSRSHCPECQEQIKWFDLIPIFSFLYLRGRCRYCRKKISWQYPIVEILSGLIWVGVFYKTFGFLDFIYYIFIFSAFLIIAVYDAKWMIIPDKLVYLSIFAAILYDSVLAFNSNSLGVLLAPLLSGFVV